MLIWLSTLPKPRAALGSASPSRSLSIVSRLCLTWCRIRNHHCSHLNCRRGVATRDFYFFSRICSIICRIIELEPGARFSLHDSSRAQAFSIAENK